MSSFTTSTPARKNAHYANKTGPIRAAYTMLLFKWDTDPTHVPHTGFQPPTVQVKAVLTLFEALFQ